MPDDVADYLRRGRPGSAPVGGAAA